MKYPRKVKKTKFSELSRNSKRNFIKVKNIPIDKKIHKKFKTFCAHNELKMKKEVENLILERMRYKI